MSTPITVNKTKLSKKQSTIRIIGTIMLMAITAIVTLAVGMYFVDAVPYLGFVIDNIGTIITSVILIIAILIVSFQPKWLETHKKTRGILTLAVIGTVGVALLFEGAQIREDLIEGPWIQIGIAVLVIVGFVLLAIASFIMVITGHFPRKVKKEVAVVDPGIPGVSPQATGTDVGWRDPAPQTQAAATPRASQQPVGARS